MADYDDEPERAWDEYEWERFLQQQDRKTEKYMELLEKYLDHPNRDEIIAREMGWTHLLGGSEEEEEDWSEEIDGLLSGVGESQEAEDADDDDDGPARLDTTWLSNGDDSFEDNALYQASFALTVWIDQLFDQNQGLQNEPSAVKLATHAALASAKLAAALNDDDVDELGMTIAYLKRALKAITTSMDGGAALLRERRINDEQHSILQQRLFQVRDGIITLMGEYRGEWRRRFGSR